MTTEPFDIGLSPKPAFTPLPSPEKMKKSSYWLHGLFILTS